MVEVAVRHDHDVDLLRRHSEAIKLAPQASSRPAEGVLRRPEPGVDEDDRLRRPDEQAVVRNVYGLRAVEGGFELGGLDVVEEGIEGEPAASVAEQGRGHAVAVAGAAAFSKTSSPSRTSTRTVSPSANSPSRSLSASGFSTRRWRARLSGRAP